MVEKVKNSIKVNFLLLFFLKCKNIYNLFTKIIDLSELDDYNEFIR
jgi:hypothetical protein